MVLALILHDVTLNKKSKSKFSIKRIISPNLINCQKMFNNAIHIRIKVHMKLQECQKIKIINKCNSFS
jgi:hypothetical protein